MTNLKYDNQSVKNSLSEFYNIFSGIVKDSQTGIEFKANSVLTIDELLALGQTAKSVYMVNSLVAWREAALQAAKEKQKSESLISRIEKMISAGQKYHDVVSCFLILTHIMLT